jgi:hypothetical protein
MLGILYKMAQCKGKTKDGKPCGRKVTPPKIYCAAHSVAAPKKEIAATKKQKAGSTRTRRKSAQRALDYLGTAAGKAEYAGYETGGSGSEDYEPSAGEDDD